eukprot:TRINITY_DN2687_c0_g1_i1.p1 TRINITY_DN2687_c0_g1~~TRINITY_DN2687_c0_g1_i1.p1  ORF type:complete len:262 (-),score=72.36 TRINITY_DN2687_c0_g1_i1:20-805(-)
MNKDNEDLECIVRSNILGVENDGEGIVLVMTGSFNPIIKTHFEMVKIARNHLEERGEKILAVVFVPNRDEVLNCKLGESFNAKFNMKNRIEMMKIARREEGAENWLCIQSFDQFIDFHVVMNKIREKLSKITPEVEVRYLCGTDRVKKTGAGIWRLNAFSQGVIAIQRGGFIVEQLDRELESKITLLETNKTLYSSVDLRRAIIEHQTIEQIEYPKVIQYLIDNEIYAHKRDGWQPRRPSLNLEGKDIPGNDNYLSVQRKS